MKCSACEEGNHYACCMATWCECECDGEAGLGIPEIDPYESECPECGMQAYNHKCQYCNENRYLPKEDKNWENKENGK